MKAVYFEEHGGIDRLRYGTLPDPTLRPGWVILRVRACSLNQLDILTRRGIPGIDVPLPWVTGGDCVGEVVAIGGGVTDVSLGERVLVDPSWYDHERRRPCMLGENVMGALAEYTTVPATQLLKLPDDISDALAATVPTAYGTAHRMLVDRAALREGESLFVLGASGGVGNACVLIGKMLGAKVIAAAGGPDKCAKLLQLGADEVVDYNSVDFQEYCRTTTGSFLRGGGYDVVVNFTGGDTWARSIRCVKFGGRLVTCGASAGFDPRTDLRFIWTGELDVRGSNGWRRSDLIELVELIRSERLAPPIDRTVPLYQGVEACAALEARQTFGKVVVQCS